MSQQCHCKSNQSNSLRYHRSRLRLSESWTRADPHAGPCGGWRLKSAATRLVVCSTIPGLPCLAESVSKQHLSTLVFGENVTVDYHKTDRYGRTVGTVLVNGRDVNGSKSGPGWPGITGIWGSKRVHRGCEQGLRLGSRIVLSCQALLQREGPARDNGQYGKGRLQLHEAQSRDRRNRLFWCHPADTAAVMLYPGPGLGKP